MRERIFIVLSLVLIVGALIFLNAASYSPTEKLPDNEARPNRSTFNGGASGTRAFYEFLRETGKPVVRWQEKPSALLNQTGANRPRTFVVIGKPRIEFEEIEINDLLKWTAQGNRLVIIDRLPNAKLLSKSGNWKVEMGVLPMVENTDSSNVNEMTTGVTAVRPAQPALLTAGVNSVTPSKFAGAINLRQDFSAEETTITAAPQSGGIFDDDEPPPPAPKPSPVKSPIYGSQTKKAPPISAPKTNTAESFPMFTPVVHLTGNDKNILVDYKYGAGQIVVLSDPYIVSNGGIELVDNLRLARNLVDGGGLIAFDEYHQGFGASGNALLNYLEGTPVLAIAAQLGLLTILLIYTQGKRFARPLPLPNPDRRSKLEYVGAMAELQRQTRAYDLAIENIYGRVRRELARFAGVDNLTTPAPVLAARVAERSRLDKNELEMLFRACEDAIHGEQIRDKQALTMIARLREIEQELGMRRRTNLKPK